MDSDRGKKRAKKMEQRCHFKIIGSGSGFHYFLWQGASKKKKILLMRFFLFVFFTVSESWRARDFQFCPLGGPGSRCSGELRKGQDGQKAARPPASIAGMEQARGQKDTLCFQLRFCDLSAKRGFTKRKPPEHSHTFWLIRLVFILTGISCLPSHFSSMLPGRI